jgi:hypothetical protein
MDFNVSIFQGIFATGFGHCWNKTLIPCEDTNTVSKPCSYCQSFSAKDALGLVLHYLNSTMCKISLQIFTIVPSSLSQYIIFGLDILLQTLYEMSNAKISGPSTLQQCVCLNSLIQNQHPCLTATFSSIDCLNLLVHTSEDIDILNAPGSWHDLWVA